VDNRYLAFFNCQAVGMYLRVGTEMTWRSVDEVQIGTDPRWATRIGPLSAPERAALERLRSGDNVDLRRHRSLESALRQAGAILPGRPSGPEFDSPSRRAWSVMRADGRGDHQVNSRSSAILEISRLGRTGLAIALTAATAGIGWVTSADTSAVRECDTGLGGFRLRDVGRSRTSATAQALTNSRPGTRFAGAIPDQPTVSVFVGDHLADPAWYRFTAAAGTPHFPVVFGEASVEVGPVVMPGVGPCLHCVDSYRLDADPAWAWVGTQLGSRPDPGEEPSLAAGAASLAVAFALGVVDGRARTGVSVLLQLGEPVPLIHTWTTHPDCPVCPDGLDPGSVAQED
jgi:hypothetical protein